MLPLARTPVTAMAAAMSRATTAVAAAADEAAGAAGGREPAGPEPHLHLGAAEDAAVDAQVAAGGLGGAAGDVQAEAGGAAAAAAPLQRRVRVGDAGAAVGDEDAGDALPLVEGDDEAGALGRVPEDVAEQRVHGGGQFGAGDRQWRGALGADQLAGASLVLGEDGPERDPVAQHLGRVAVAPAGGPPDRPDDLVDLALDPVDGLAGLV